MFAKKSISRIFSILFIMMFMLSVAPLQAVQAAGVRFAKPTASGSGDCSSWANACILQDALTGAVSGDEIWAAAGMYKPTPGTDRNATFQLKNGVALYGGFAGTETARDDRNPLAHVTILSGDIDNNDSQTPIITNLSTVEGNTTNSYHVVTGVTGATLDGFTITAGNANTAANACPGTACGGGMYNYNSSSPTLTDIIFIGNSAYIAGGGMINHSSSSPILTNVTFSRNSQTYDWGGDGGGGLYNVFSSNPTLTNVTFSQNSGYNGGGMTNYVDSNPTVTNGTFSGNVASQYGGGMYTSGSNPVMLNVTFDGNTAVSNGGGLNIASGSAQIRNTIFWGNTAPTGAQIWDDGSTPSVRDSVVQGGYPAGTNIITTDPLLGALGNYGGFTQTIPLTTGSSAINATSSNCPATDQRGVPRSNPTCDIGAYEVFSLLAVPGGKTSGLCESWANACELRYALSTVASGEEIWVAAGTYKPTAGTDRGATFLLVNNIAVYGGFAGTETALSQRNPSVRVTILSGEIGAVGNSDNSYHVVTGATGATLDGFTITAGNANGMDCPGTSCGGGMFNDSSSPTLNNITFSGNSAGYGGGIVNYLGDPILTGITFSGNSATVAGGGMANSSSSPMVTNVTFSGNSAAENGGGMVNYSSSPTLANVSFSGNLSTLGGGMSNFSSSPTLTDVTFSGNTAAHSGGMYTEASSNPTLMNVTFSGNQATTGDGGGLGNDGGNPSLTNVTFSGNSGHYGGGIFNQSGSPTLTNVTFSGNTAQYGGGLYTIYASSPTIRNTIFWGNTASGGEPQIWNSGSSLSVSDSVVQGGYAGGTNILTTDPKLGTLGNYGGFTQTIPLLEGSSAINTGNATYCPVTDQRGITRPQGVHCDIGPYEYVDNTAPTVLSSVRINSNPTNLASVGFTVTFSEPVTGVDKDDFSLTISGVSGASVTGVSGSGSDYTVTVNTGSGNGSIRLDVPAGGVSITDLIGNPLANLPYSGGQTYTVIKTYPVYLPLVKR